MHTHSCIAAITLGALSVLSPLAGLRAAPARVWWTAPAATLAPDDPTPADLARIGEALAPALVRVEFTVQYDKGESPGSDYYSARARYGAYFGGEYDSGGSDWDRYINEERPAERAGYLISPTRVLTADPMLHPRFIKEIAVRFGDTVVKATPAAYGRDRGALFLDLAQPLTGAKPLQFDASKPGPYLAAGYTEHDGAWTVSVGTAPPRASVKTGGKSTDASKRGFTSRGEALIVDRAGTPVAISMGGQSKTDDSWKGSPEKWATCSVGEMDKMLADVERVSGGAILRVSLGFRSPRNAGSADPYGMGGAYGRYMGGDAEPDITQWHGSAVLVDDKTILVLANFKPKTTGRLEKIQVFAPSGEVKGTFEGTLADYGGFLATLDQPVSGAAHLYTGDITELREQLLMKAEVTVHGEIRTAYYSRDRIGSYYLGWRRNIFPSVAAARMGQINYYGRGGGDEASSLNFLFTPTGELVCVPLAHREKVAVRDPYGYADRFGGGGGQMTPGAMVGEVLRDHTKNFDQENRPVSEDDENRLAWLGVEMQGMDPDLARENNVTDQTRGGTSGGMVTFVYPSGPAAKAGIKLGDILLRVHVQGQPKPIEVQVMGDFGMGGMMDRFWESLDQMPAEYLDRLPKPWGTVENPLVRSLTDVGFGTPFKAEVFRDGKVSMIDFKVEQGPAHYDSAKRFKSEAGGLTVRDLTYEVRRFFQLKDDEPGVIISKVEQGEKAAVAGLKPYELITAVNDKPVKTVGELEQALAGGGELRLNVKRMTTGRIVKLKLDPATTKAPDADK